MKLAAKRFATSKSLPRRPDHCMRSNDGGFERVEPRGTRAMRNSAASFPRTTKRGVLRSNSPHRAGDIGRQDCAPRGATTPPQSDRFRKRITQPPIGLKVDRAEAREITAGCEPTRAQAGLHSLNPHHYAPSSHSDTHNASVRPIGKTSRPEAFRLSSHKGHG